MAKGVPLPMPISDASLRFSTRFSYGFLGLPLSFLALPLYVSLPHYYASRLGVSLSLLGLVLLLTRVLDAWLDPWLGRKMSVWMGQARSLYAPFLLAIVLALAFNALWWPGYYFELSPPSLLVFLVVSLTLAYLSFSVLSIWHNAWVTQLGQNDAQRSRLVAWREGFALLGVVLATQLPNLWGRAPSYAFWALLLLLGVCSCMWLVSQRNAVIAVLAPAINPVEYPASASATEGSLWQHPWFRRLMMVFVFNGIAGAVAATLMPFFVADVLRREDALAQYFLVYFVATLLSLPLWTRWAGRFSLVRVWAWGIVGAIIIFALLWFAPLHQGGNTAHYIFLAVCAGTGFALGADLVLPSTLLAQQIVRSAATRRSAEFFAWWTAANKLNLALAAGLTLPLLAYLSYTPGEQSWSTTRPLVFVYVWVPVVFKAVALLVLMGFSNSKE